MNNTIFANPIYFYLMLLLPLLALWYWYSYRSRFPVLRMPSLSPFTGMSSGWRAKLRPILFVCRMLAFIFLITGLARPQNTLKEQQIDSEGIDIVLALDVSTSMLAEDLKPNRIEAAKNVAFEFVEGRNNDRIGLVVFAGESFTQCPITTDQKVVKQLITEIKSGLIEDGTAIGMGMGTAVSRLKDSDAKSKVIILLTDGENNAGFIDPLTAAATAKEYGIRTYTIGVGTRGMAPYPFQGPFGRKRYQNVEVKIDEELLKEISLKTDGKYFRATSNEALKKVYAEINKLEKSKIEITSINRYFEEFYWFVLIAFGLLLLEWILRLTVFKAAP